MSEPSPDNAALFRRIEGLTAETERAAARLQEAILAVDPEHCGPHFRPESLDAVQYAIDRARMCLAELREKLSRTPTP